MTQFKTEQETFWAGEFGTEYSSRNIGDDWIASNTVLFSKILSKASRLDSVLELGANIGLNILALKQLLPNAELSAVEINQTAVSQLKNIKNLEVFDQSILDFNQEKQWDMVFTKGVLIHIDPGCLSEVYSKLYAHSKRYICIAEYYNPSPVTISYRGHDERLYKRDFAGEMLDEYDSLRLVEYGFCYHRDVFPQDDLSWFLLEKIGTNKFDSNE